MRSKIPATLLLAAALVGWAPYASAAPQPPKPTPAQEGFVPIEDLPAQDQLPAARLLMTAYAVAWLAVFGYLWSIWQRLGRVEREIAAVNRRVEAGSRR
jgi:CcmD family protein